MSFGKSKARVQMEARAQVTLVNVAALRAPSRITGGR